MKNAPYKWLFNSTVVFGCVAGATWFLHGALSHLETVPRVYEKPARAVVGEIDSVSAEQEPREWIEARDPGVVVKVGSVLTGDGLPRPFLQVTDESCEGTWRAATGLTLLNKVVKGRPDFVPAEPISVCVPKSEGMTTSKLSVAWSAWSSSFLPEMDGEIYRVNFVDKEGQARQIRVAAYGYCVDEFDSCTSATHARVDLPGEPAQFLIPLDSRVSLVQANGTLAIGPVPEDKDSTRANAQSAEVIIAE